MLTSNRSKTARTFVHLAMWGALLALADTGPAAATTLAGDIDGDGYVTTADEQALQTALAAGADFEPAADLNGDGVVDVVDLAMFGTNFGQSGGTPDTTPPGLFITLNEIPDHMNDLLVVPPSGFRITLSFDAGGHSAIDTASLSVTSSQDLGPFAAGTDFGAAFAITPTGAVYEVPTGADLARTAHFLEASIGDLAGNLTQGEFGFAVRDFQGAGSAPLANLQLIHLDFDQDRTLGPEIDFIEDLREFGLTSAAAPQYEQSIRDLVVNEIVSRVQAYFVQDDGDDPANILFVSEAPQSPHSRICIGGESTLGQSHLGAAALDLHNISKTTNECALGPQFGIFPHALDNLWGSDPDFQSAFASVDPTYGGVPFGLDPLDAAIASPDFDFTTASGGEIGRFVAIIFAADAFAQAVATATAHEVGHMLGLTAPGPAPAGLWGGSSGEAATHNAAVGGGPITANWLMNPGSSFSFGELTGRGGQPLARFRPLNWAYLTGRIALNDNVMGLFPPPTLDSVSPSVVSFPPGTQNVTVSFHGSDFSAPIGIDLITAGDPTPNDVIDVIFVDSNTVTGVLNKFSFQTATYDVHLTNGDGQETTLEAALVVQ